MKKDVDMQIIQLRECIHIASLKGSIQSSNSVIGVLFHHSTNYYILMLQSYEG